MWQKQQKIKQWDAEVVDLKMISLFLLRHLVQSPFV